MESPIQDRGVEAKSSRFQGKSIAVGICGGIGAVEIVRIIREIRRHGASVVPYLTPSAEAFITPLSVGWAADREPVRVAGFGAEHLDPFDLVLIAPATLNTISKAALGIADNAVTMLIAGQFGRKGKVLFAPTMNQQLQSHPIYADHLRTLESWGARVLSLGLEEGRLKMPLPEIVVAAIGESLSC